MVLFPKGENKLRINKFHVFENQNYNETYIQHESIVCNNDAMRTKNEQK